jgi:hypothetical protein
MGLCERSARVVVRSTREDVHACLIIAQEPVLLKHLAYVLVIIAHHCVCINLAIGAYALK